MLQTRVEDDHVERDAFAESRGVRVFANITTFIFHIRRFIPVAVVDCPWGQVDGDDLHLPFFRTESGYLLREMAGAAPRIENT